jgi:pyridoxal phosphate enzyme (YggS family)
MSPEQINENLSDIVARIEAARKAAVKPAPATTLVAITKTHAAETITPALIAGQRVFGENWVQEALAKWPAIRSDYSDVELHLVGPLQTNKVRDAIALFDAIQTLDRPKLADALRTEMDRSDRTPFLFIQVNTGEEPQKSGVLPREAPPLIAHARALKLPLKGLMCIPPASENPAPHFALLR